MLQELHSHSIPIGHTSLHCLGFGLNLNFHCHLNLVFDKEDPKTLCGCSSKKNNMSPYGLRQRKPNGYRHDSKV